jgi:hypothetical protein
MASKLKVFSLIVLMLTGIIAVSGIAHADSVPVDANTMKVYINDREVENGELRSVERGSKVDLEVKLTALGDDSSVSVEASVEGLDHDSEKATDKTDVFTIKNGETYYKKLSIQLPDRMDVDQYAIRVEVSNRKDDLVVYNAILSVDPTRNSVTIKDVIFSPNNEVKAGRALLTTVRLKNVGEKTEESVKVAISMPELGLSTSDYVDEVEAEDSVTSQELYLRIPECTKAGDYKATVTATFDDGDKSISQDYVLHVVADDTCNVASQSDAGKTIITINGESQDVVAGESGVVYPITLTNTGTVAKTFTVSAIAGSWADVKVSPSVVVLGASETKIVYVTVAAKKDAAAGAQTFGVVVKSADGTTLKEVTLQANVLKGSSGWDNVKKGLEVALVVLVVLLVIIGLIIGFNRLKGNEEEENKEETYY